MRVNRTWAALFIFMVTCSLLLATTASYALTDPK
jgi:hypothetical protein